MSSLNTLQWHRNGSQVNLGIDSLSLQEQGRIVEGYATLDNVDFAGDIVDPEASYNAFKNFRGNIRVQHDKTRPVGRLVGFEPTQVYDEETGKTFNAIKVAVRISEGAEEIWKMCVDGTLSGFSIGAAVKKASIAYNAELNKNVQLIEEYALLELSLVDNPMNKLANIISVYKAVDADEDVVNKGFASSNLFWCAVDRIATPLHAESASCPKCGGALANLGYIDEDEDIKAKLFSVFENKKGGHPQVADVEKSAEEVTPSAEDSVEVTTEVAEAEAPEADAVVETQAAEVVEVEEAVEAPVEELEAVTEDDADVVTDSVEEDGEKSLEDKLEEFLAQVRDQFLEEYAVAVKALQSEIADRIEKIEEAVDSMSKALDGVTEAQSELREKLSTVENVTEKLQTVEQRLDKVADETAVQKSVNAFDDEDVVEKAVDAAPKKPSFSGVFSTGIVGLDC